MSKQLKIDLSVQIKRNVENQNYHVSLLVINESNTGPLELIVCQTLPEIMSKIAEFEAKHLEQFENAIDYVKTDWRELARKNREAQAKQQQEQQTGARTRSALARVAATQSDAPLG